MGAFRSFSRLARQADVLHYLYPWPFADVLRVVIRPKNPAILTYISDVVRQRWLGSLYMPLMWRTLQSMRVIVANSPAYARTSPVLSHPSIRGKVRIIPLGIDENSYPTIGDSSVLERLGLQNGEPYFLFVGVFRYYKGLHILLQAATRVGAKIVVAGNGPEEARLRALASQIAANNVIFAGRITDEEKVTLMRGCRAFVLPSHLRSEAYGMVLVEASMFGKPLVSCEIGTGTSYVNSHEETGLVVKPEDPIALSRAMNDLLTNNGMAIQFGLSARARYEKLFSAPALGRAYADLYKEVVCDVTR